MEVSNIYPIGKFQFPEQYNFNDIKNWIQEIEIFPKNLRLTLTEIPERDYVYSYRLGGWTISQLVHHLSDSHLNAYIRFKLALTEYIPTVKPYSQDDWAKLPDYTLNPHVSLSLLESIREKWICILKSLSENDYRKTYYHPEYQKEQSLAYVLALYSWDGKHHIAQIKKASELKIQ